MNAIDDPIGGALIILGLIVVSALVFSVLCAVSSVCERLEYWWRTRGVIGSWVNEPAPECRKLNDIGREPTWETIARECKFFGGKLNERTHPRRHTGGISRRSV